MSGYELRAGALRPRIAGDGERGGVLPWLSRCGPGWWRWSFTGRIAEEKGVTQQERIYAAFVAVQQQQAAPDLGAQSLAGMMVQADAARAETSRLATGVLARAADRAAGLGGTSASRSSSTGAAAAAPGGGSVWDSVSKFLPIPLIATELFGLFSSAPDPVAPLIHYALPQSVAFAGVEAADGVVSSADYDQSGAPRSYGLGSSAPAAAAQTAAAVAAPLPGSDLSRDPRYFLDRQDAISAAVREALLYGHGLGDVINDL